MGLQAEHRALLRVVHHLQQPLHPAFEPPSPPGSSAAAAHATLHYTPDMAVKAAPIAAPPKLPPPAGRGTEIPGHHHHHHDNRLLESDPVEGVSADAAQGGAAPLLPRPRMASTLPSMQAASREEARLSVCSHVAGMGLSEVCMRWGQIQEPASLYALLHVFPRALLFEVGMFVIPDSSLPTHWGFGPGSLPPLGSSPDGLIAHPIQANTDELQWLLKTCASLASYQTNHNHDSRPSSSSSSFNSNHRSSNNSKFGNRNRSTPNSRPSSSRNGGMGNGNSNGRVDCQELSNLKARVRATLQQLLQQVPLRLSHLGDEKGEEQARGQGSGPPAVDGSSINICAKRQGEESGGEQKSPQSNRTAAQLGTNTNISATVIQREGGGEGDCDAWQGAQAEQEETDEDAGLRAALVDLAASAVGAAQLLGACAPVVTTACLQQQLHSGEVRHVREREQHDSCRREQHVSCKREQQPRQLQHAMVLEAVEVKNTVPFSQAAHKAGTQGGAKVRFCIRDRGPREAVAFHWVPQLMLHMLATGTWSALLICRSVTKGIRVFRIFRDDEYLFRMISILNRLYTQYVLQGREPPPNAFNSEPSYASLLSNTARIARSAIEVAFVGGPAPRPENTDSRAFV
ncbi:hypothetical protein DUNSADRAFT_10232 [Dunaliella salina]|nr:hypothetical protein DUNSADRAFT_10232 [Dunaliella salina]|eukprot:KAF5833442.1 hypothetical protein DUNSADRAFT_10232 [Dunaliella salina]